MQVVGQRKPITPEYPLVSVIMPIYNEANSLPAAIASLGRQNYPHLEIILIDDGSTDNTRQVVDRLTPRLPNYLHYFYQENQGSAVARNRGLSQAKGEGRSLPADTGRLHQILRQNLDHQIPSLFNDGKI
ncbi:MAG: hypothetical protein RLZZ148_2809 [Cyanobacteriota bacterium]